MKEYLNKFKDLKVLIVGDIILDEYVSGSIKRNSPEAPVPVVDVDKKWHTLGGAANTALNVKTLGGTPILFGVVGEEKEILLNKFKKEDIDTDGILETKRITTTKTRILNKDEQLLRIDEEDTSSIEKSAEGEIVEQVQKLNDIDIVIISDYAKGVISKELFEEIATFCKLQNISLLVDPRPQNKKCYVGASLITPNKKESEDMSGINIKDKKSLHEAGRKLSVELDCNVIITMGDEGMTVFEKDAEPVTLPTMAQDVFDVSGAGDTVVASIALSLASGANLKDAASIANRAAGIKVKKIGTAPVYFDELKEELK